MTPHDIAKEDAWWYREKTLELPAGWRIVLRIDPALGRTWSLLKKTSDSEWKSAAHLIPLSVLEAIHGLASKDWPSPMRRDDP
jgi:hypothetical protein